MGTTEVMEFMNHVAPNIGDRFSPNTVQRKFRTSYAKAQLMINELVEQNFLQENVNAKWCCTFYVRIIK